MSFLRLARSVTLGMVFVTACVGDTTTASSLRSPETTLGSLTVTPGAAIVAVGGTQQLTPSGISLTGVPMTTFDSVLYVLNTASDSVRVRIAGTGLVTGLAASPSVVRVNVFAFRDGLARAEQSLIEVAPVAVPGAMLSVQPVVPDSAKLARGTTKTIVPVVANATTGASVPSPLVRYTVAPADSARVNLYVPSLVLPGADGATAKVGQGGIGQIRPLVGEGNAWIYADVNAFGTPLRDSVRYAFSYAYAANVQILSIGNALLFSLGGVIRVSTVETVTLAPGAVVTFSVSVTGQTVAFVFDNPAAATAATPPSANGGAAGNITALSAGQTSQRKFSTAGTYRWTATASGGDATVNGRTISGIIVIK